MSFSRTTRRWMTLAVLASYVLVITFSGLFHEHGTGSCCSGNGCSLPVATSAQDESTCSEHHHHHHTEADHCHHGASHVPAECPSGPHSDDPLKHSDCAACQLLAQQSLSTPTFVLECSGIGVFGEFPVLERWVLSVPHPAHPARGPPSQG